MDEKSLKNLFIQYITAAHNYENNFLSIDPRDPEIEIRIRDEGYYRNFDLIIAVIKKRYSSEVESNWISSGQKYLNIIMRSNS